MIAQTTRYVKFPVLWVQVLSQTDKTPTLSEGTHKHMMIYSNLGHPQMAQGRVVFYNKLLQTQQTFNGSLIQGQHWLNEEILASVLPCEQGTCSSDQ